ncbi:glycosyltransferase family A protein [Haloferula chungangensis]|uniref:Glycosyltransferase family A protein n=1 Tax=Haloferula chungangensis TaxID=1048331 RepID=A0ABW2KZS7_9BACT
MKLTTVINNFNYESYLVEAIDSLLKQTRPPDQIIVVDDGSTDDSLKLLQEKKISVPDLVIIAQQNQGQLAALKSAIQIIDDGIVTFLDADDFYYPMHCQEIEAVFADHPEVGICYSDHQETSGPRRYSSKWPEKPIGPNPCLVRMFGSRFGTITSAIAMKVELAKHVTNLPDKLMADWRTRADDVLVFGASLAGAISYYHDKKSVAYRIHGANHFAESHRKANAEQDYRARRDRLFQALESSNGLDSDFALNHLISESRSALNIADETVRRRYMSAIWRSALPPLSKTRAIAKLLFSGLGKPK